MFNFGKIAKEDIKKNNRNWSETPGHPYRILIVGGFGSPQTNTLLNLMNDEPDIYKIISYDKDQYKAKHQSLINKRKSTVLKYFNDFKASIKYSNNMSDMCKNIVEDNPNKKQKTLIYLIWLLICLVIKSLIQQ